VGATGEAALITYSDEVTVRKPFESGDLRAAFRKIAIEGKEAHLLDAAMRGLELLKERHTRSRILLLIGQPMDHGSKATLAALRAQVERENVAVYAMALPHINAAFVSDTFSLQELSSRSDRGGFKVGADLKNLIAVLSHSADTQADADPFTVLTAATGGTQLHFRAQRQMEDAVSIIGTELRSVYSLSYTPDSTLPGYHTISVEVDVPNAKIYARPGYELR
jgi:hypothetical protein